MQRQYVTSSDIHSVGYDIYTSTLEIQFNSGGIYQYSNVPIETYNNFMNASSLGKFFHAFIKNTYSCTPIS